MMNHVSDRGKTLSRGPQVRQKITKIDDSCEGYSRQQDESLLKDDSRTIRNEYNESGNPHIPIPCLESLAAKVEAPNIPVPSLGSLPARGFTSGDAKSLGRNANWAFDLEALVLGALD